MKTLFPITAAVTCLPFLLSTRAAAKGPTKTTDAVASRIAGRSFPSVFQAWAAADNLKNEDRLTTVARHDLVFHGVEFFGLRWDHGYTGLATRLSAKSIPHGLTTRRTLLGKNPNMVLLAEIRYRDAPRRWLPAEHKWWKRDRSGRRAAGWSEGGFMKLDFQNAEYRRHVAARAKAAVDSGALDGVMLDWWRDDADRLALVKAVRKAVGDAALILVNPNDRKTPLTAPFVNGYFMECYRSKTPADWRRIAETLAWAEKNLRRPRVNCLETWYHRSRKDLHLMRAATTLSLTHSDGYCLFSDPNTLPTGDHRHNWYPFWNKRLGKPKSPGRKRSDGTFVREYDSGTVIYNPMGNRRATVRFTGQRRSLATGRIAEKHTVNPCDGDIFIGPRTRTDNDD